MDSWPHRIVSYPLIRAAWPERNNPTHSSIIGTDAAVCCDTEAIKAGHAMRLQTQLQHKKYKFYQTHDNKRDC